MSLGNKNCFKYNKSFCWETWGPIHVHMHVYKAHNIVYIFTLTKWLNKGLHQFLLFYENRKFQKCILT